MENEMLYFFSTIPQILAAIIALVFVFLKLQNIDKSISVICRGFAGILGRNVFPFNWQDLGSGYIFMGKYKSQDFNNISSIMFTTRKERENDNKMEADRLKKIVEKVLDIESKKNNLIKRTKYLTIFSFIVIVTSLSIIPFIKVIILSNFWTYFLVFLFILVSIIIFIGIYLIFSKSAE